MNVKKATQSSITLMLVIIISKIVGMLRDIVLANYFGTSNISDAYLIASSVPTLLFYFIGHSLSTAYIPMYNKIKADRGSEGALKYSNKILCLTLCLSTIIIIVLYTIPNLLVKVLAAGFDVETTNIAVKLIRISAPCIYFMTLVHILSGYLQANKNFIDPASISLPRNFAIVLSVVISATYGIEWLGIGLLIAYVLEFISLLPFVISKGYRFRFSAKFKDEDVKHTFNIVAPILLGMCVGQVNKIVDRSMASTIVEGGISALTYASVINNAVQEILVTGIITILFASCSELVAYGKHEEVKKKLSITVNTLLFLLIPACLGVIVLAEPIVKLILCRGEFNEISLQMTSSALQCYTAGLLFLAIRDTFVKVFYAYEETKITTITSICAILLNIVLNIVLGKILGIQGLALATSISAACNSFALFIFLNKKIGDFGMRSAFSVLWKSILSAAIMIVGVYYSFLWTSEKTTEFIALIASIFIGFIVYMLASLTFRNSPLINFLRNMKNNPKTQGDK